MYRSVQKCLNFSFLNLFSKWVERSGWFVDTLFSLTCNKVKEGSVLLRFWKQILVGTKRSHTEHRAETYLPGPWVQALPSCTCVFHSLLFSSVNYLLTSHSAAGTFSKLLTWAILPQRKVPVNESPLVVIDPGEKRAHGPNPHWCCLLNHLISKRLVCSYKLPAPFVINESCPGYFLVQSMDFKLKCLHLGLHYEFPSCKILEWI